MAPKGPPVVATAAEQKRMNLIYGNEPVDMRKGGRVKRKV